MLPLFEPGVGLVGIEPYYALEDQLEAAVGMSTTCRVDQISLGELPNFLGIANAIAANSNVMFHFMAYDCLRRFALQGLQKRQEDPKSRTEPTASGMQRALQMLGVLLVAGQIFDSEAVKIELRKIGGAV